jgi:hypothetical protein
MTNQFVEGSRSNFPKIPDLVGALIMISPIKVEQVPNTFKSGELSARLTADVVVFDGSHEGDYTNMWLSQAVFIRTAEPILRKNNGQKVLGRLRRVPKPEHLEIWPDSEALEKGFTEQGPGKPGPAFNSFTWVIDAPTAADKARALGYLDGSQPLLVTEDAPDQIAVSDPEDADPFA